MNEVPKETQENGEPQSSLEYQKAMLSIGRRLVEQRTVQQADRRVANVGEYTQSVIAVLVVVSMCYGVIVLHAVRMQPEFWTIVGLVIGFYFGRNRPLGTVAVGRSPEVRTRATDGVKKEGESK